MKYNDKYTNLQNFEKNKIIIDNDVFYSFKKSLKKKLFVKLYYDSLSFFTNSNVNKRIQEFLFQLLKLTKLGTGQYVIIKSKTATINEISLELNIKTRTLFNYINELEKHEVLKKIKNGREKNIIFNPFFLSNSKTIEDEIIQIFSKTSWAR